MKNSKAIIRIATLTLSAAAVVGIIILLLDSSNAQRTIYELIAFMIGICAIAMAILEQLNTRRLEHRMDHMQNEMLILLKEEHQDKADGKYVRDKLAEILASQHGLKDHSKPPKKSS